MAWIQQFADDEATGRLGRAFRAAKERVGRVFGIVRIMGLAPPVLDASMGLYQKVMYATEGLTRVQREMLAVVVSVQNHCHY